MSPALGRAHRPQPALSCTLTTDVGDCVDELQYDPAHYETMRTAISHSM